MEFIKFMVSTAGRITRIVAGLVLVYVGFFVMNNVGGYILAAFGLVPLLVGLCDFCVLAPLFSAPLSDKSIRKL
jgi:hypothetical protein